MPKAFNEIERDRIRKKLFEVGKRLINQMGVRRLVVDDVVREVGISKGSFYLFFPSREDFILSVFESWEQEYRGALIRQVTEGGGTARERLERFFLGAFEIMDREPGLAQIGAKEIQTLIDRLPSERMEAHKAADDEVLEGTLRLWVAEGMVDSALAETFHGLLSALFSMAMHRGDFPEGSYGPTTRLISEALAMRIARSPLTKEG